MKLNFWKMAIAIALVLLGMMVLNDIVDNSVKSYKEQEKPQKVTVIKQIDRDSLSRVYDTVVATCYYPSVSQTDTTPFITASNSLINQKYPHSHRWVAVSRDLLKYYKMGDTIKVEGTWVYDGYWIVNDKMNKRYSKRIDFLVSEGMFMNKWEDIKISKK